MRPCLNPADYSESDDHQVSLVLDGEVQDVRFLAFMERVGSETLAHFTTDDFLLLDAIHRESAIPERLKARLASLIGLGVIESTGRGRGTRYLLSQRFYNFAGQRGVYTRRRGLDRDTNKALLLKHIRRNDKAGSPLQDLQDVLPALSKKQIQYLLSEMKGRGEIHVRGRTRGARWYAGLAPDEAEQP